MAKPKLTLLLANPRGFCAGVERAIQIVEAALDKYGPPVYVRHEIVHNRTVIETLESKGAVFVKDLSDLPGDMPLDRPVIFSAHGVPKSVPQEAERLNLFYIDATCPLVSKVHLEIGRHARNMHEIILIGHAHHPEVIGTMGQLNDYPITLIETQNDAETFIPKDPGNLAYVTQTTLSVDDTADIIAILKKRFPNIHGPKKEDICYATTNRQTAIKKMAPQCDAFLVLGAPNSSNSNRLIDVAQAYGCKNASLIQNAAEIDWSLYKDGDVLGLSAGASAPEHLVQDVIAAAQRRFDITMQDITTAQEDIVFKLPRVLAA